MANQLGSTTTAPRCHSHHQRHRRFARVRILPSVHSDQFEQFLTVQATRLSSTTALIFAKLTKNTADRIAAASTFGSLA